MIKNDAAEYPFEALGSGGKSLRILRLLNFYFDSHPETFAHCMKTFYPDISELEMVAGIGLLPNRVGIDFDMSSREMCLPLTGQLVP